MRYAEVEMKLNYWVMIAFLAGGAFWDIRRKEIPALYLKIFTVTGLLYQVVSMLTAAAAGEAVWMQGLSWLAGCTGGLLLAGIAQLTGESVGYGDAWTAGILGLWLGLISMAEILFTGLMLTAVYAAWLSVVRRKGRGYRIPFLPFLLGGYIFWLILMRIGGVL